MVNSLAKVIINDVVLYPTPVHAVWKRRGKAWRCQGWGGLKRKLEILFAWIPM